MGLFGGSSKSSSTTTNIDERIANQDGIAVNADQSATVNVESVDDEIVARALATVDINNALLGEGYKKLFEAGQQMIGTTQKHVADAYSQASQDSIDRSGTIDNKTLIVIVAIAGVLVFYSVMNKKRGA